MRGCAAWRCHVLACAGPEAALSGAGGSSGGLACCDTDTTRTARVRGQGSRMDGVSRYSLSPRRPAPSRRTDTRGQRYAPRRIEVLRPWRAWTGPARTRKVLAAICPGARGEFPGGFLDEHYRAGAGVYLHAGAAFEAPEDALPGPLDT